MQHRTSLRLLVLVTALVVIVVNIAVAADDTPTPAEPHICGFDRLRQYHNVTPTAVTLKHQDPITGAMVYEGVSRSSSGTYEPIRIGVFSYDLDDPSKYCTSFGGTAPDFLGGTMPCTSDDVLTAKKKDILKNTIVPQAIQLHIDRLKVERLTSPIKIPADMNPICGNFSIPSSHKTEGVSGYDFVLYVAAAPTIVNSLGGAVPCAYLQGPNGEVGRPIAGVLSVSPAYCDTRRSTLRTVAREILHALGFTQEFFEAAGMYSTTTVRQKTDVPVITSSRVVNAAKEHYGCDSLTSMELEDYGGEGLAGSHWKRRNAKDDLMTFYSTHGYYTAMTIAAMEDLGYYQGDYSKAEEMPWGKNAGCKLLTDMCMTNSVSLDESMFCTGGASICTSDRDAVGTCRTSSTSLPSWAASYGLSSGDGFMDYCPYVVPYNSNGCSTVSFPNAPDAESVGNSRCLDVSSGSAECAVIRCTDTTYTVQFESGKALKCTPGSTVKIPKTKRTATCPPYTEVCDGPTKGGNVATTSIGCSGVLLVLLGVLASMLM